MVKVGNFGEIMFGPLLHQISFGKKWEILVRLCLAHQISFGKKWEILVRLCLPQAVNHQPGPPVDPGVDANHSQNEKRSHLCVCISNTV